MTNFNVRWEIDIEAETPEDAVLQARQYQLDQGARVGYFTVHWADRAENFPLQKDIDLDDEELS